MVSQQRYKADDLILLASIPCGLLRERGSCLSGHIRVGIRVAPISRTEHIDQLTQKRERVSEAVWSGDQYP